MERKKNRIKDNVGSYNESCDKESASTKVYAAHFVLQKCPKSLKENLEKRKTVVFRKRVSAKTTAGARSYSQGVVLYSYNIGEGFLEVFL